MLDYLVPFLLILASAVALGKRESSYQLLLDGGAEGLRLMITLAPALVMLMTGVTMFRASGRYR